jgi:paraquat-inducible protein A
MGTAARRGGIAPRAEMPDPRTRQPRGEPAIATRSAAEAAFPGLSLRSARAAEAAREAAEAAAEVVACHACALVHRVLPSHMPDQGVAACTRCGTELYRRVDRSVDRSLACHLGALLLFYVANAYPIMAMGVEGRSQAATIAEGALSLWREGMPFVAAVVLLAGTLVPLAKILGGLYVLVPVRLGLHHPPAMPLVFRWTLRARPWAMMEVYLLGLIVAYVKLGDTATVEVGVAALAFVALILTLAAADANLEPHAVWARIARQAGLEAARAAGSGTILVSCRDCEQVVPLPERAAEDGQERCPRCAARLHRRKPESLARAWALLAAAAILYVPANTLPVMTVVYLGQGEPSTILGGIVTLIEEDMLPIALLVLFASVVVPVVKILGLAALLVSAQRRSAWRPRDRTRVYRLIEGVGRWSMVDVFMIAILTALVRFGALSSVEPGLGAAAFCAVVILTMLAAMAFDPRLIWDAVDERARDQAPAAAPPRA